MSAKSHASMAGIAVALGRAMRSSLTARVFSFVFFGLLVAGCLGETGGLHGDDCTTEEPCAKGHVCWENAKGPGVGRCVQTCESEADCSGLCLLSEAVCSSDHRCSCRGL